MPHYKDQNNNVHFLEDRSFERLLPNGSIEISDEEARLISESSVNNNSINADPSSAKILADALVSKGILTKEEIDTVAQENGVTFFQNS